jgi:hypothetical protein
MWPLTNHQSFRSSALNEFSRRYRNHLETLPPDRLLLFQKEEFDLSEGSVSGALEQDCARAIKEFERQMIAKGIADIQEVRPGLSKHHFFISVVLRPGVEAKEYGLPEFFDGYIVDVAPQIILPGLKRRG